MDNTGSLRNMNYEYLKRLVPNLHFRKVWKIITVLLFNPLTPKSAKNQNK